MQSISAEGVLATHQRRRLVENQWAAPEGLVYPDWDSADGTPLRGQPCTVGVDYGESGVTAAVFLQRVDRQSALFLAQKAPSPSVRGLDAHQWLVCAEWYYDGRTQGYLSPEEQARRIKNAAPGPIAACYVDPSAPSLRHALEQVVPAYRAYNRERGYDITNGDLQSRTLLIDDGQCPSLVSELEELVYNARGDKPDPNCSDHATDALRYAACAVTAQRGATAGGIELR